MKIVAIVQARLGSTRLPRKSLLPLQGKSLTWHVLNRVLQSTVDDVVLAIPEEQDSRLLKNIARSLHVPCFVMDGDPSDLLHRYRSAALNYDADVIVRVPADNPCVDPDEIDRIVGFYLAHHKVFLFDYLFSNLDQNIENNGYPGGLGA